jgi:hypothetical protein
MNAVDRILAKLGSNDSAIARQLGLTRPAIRYWRRKGRIPHWNVPFIEGAALDLGITISKRDLVAAVMGE